VVDRASAFDDREVVELLKTRYVPVAPSLTELIKSKDPAGDFFRKVVGQRAEPKHTKQGYYIASPDGTLVVGWMYPRPDDGTMKKNLAEALKTYRPPKQIDRIDASKVDRQCNPVPPDGAAVIEVCSKVLDAKWGPSPAKRVDMIRDAVGRDRLWILRAEREALLRGELADSLLERVIRFHLVDNTRGVPRRWKQEEMKAVELKLAKGTLQGRVQLDGFDVQLYGRIEAKGGALSRFDVVARGVHDPKKTEVGEVPLAPYTVAIAFALSESGEPARVPPLFSWDLPDYLRTAALRVTELRRK